MEQNYPEITYEMVFKIYTVCQNMKADENYLDNSKYAEPIKKALSLMFPAEEPVDDALLDTSELDIRKESEILYRQTKELLSSNALDEKDKASVLKTSTTLLEKLLNILERSENISKMREFETKVLQAMKKVAPEVRDNFLAEIERLGARTDIFDEGEE
jgi:hypothetical protein